MTKEMLSPSEFQELCRNVKLQIEIDGYDVYVTDIIVHNSDRIEVKFFCKEQYMEDELAPHVQACIMKLIEEQRCLLNKQSFQIWSTIKSILQKLFRI